MGTGEKKVFRVHAVIVAALVALQFRRYPGDLCAANDIEARQTFRIALRSLAEEPWHPSTSRHPS